jgi:Zn-finger nucleic acid-binding protein
MTESVYGDVSIDECFACGGMWFDELELQRFVARFRARKETVEGPPLDGKLKRFSPSDPVVYLPCPRCGRPMTRHNFGRISGVILDRCGHGMWLDGGELEKIVDFIQTGGLVEGERRRVEHLKDQARSAEMRADIARGTASRYRGIGGLYVGPMVFWDIW